MSGKNNGGKILKTDNLKIAWLPKIEFVYSHIN